MLTCRPRFVLWAALLRQLPLQLFLTVWAGLFFGGLLSVFRVMVAAATTRGGLSADVLGALLSGPATIGFAFFLGVPLVTVGSKWLNYCHTRYLIDDRYVTVEEGFFTVQAKRILVRDVREVALRRGLLQRASGLGSVYLASRVQGGGWAWRGSPMLGATSLVGSGVMLMDLPDWHLVFEHVQAQLARGDGALGAGRTS